MERSFAREIAMLGKRSGEMFHGEGILAIAKGLLQSGVSYVGGYQGAPVSHLVDVFVQASELLDGLGVQVQACSNEASAAALLAASIHYPVRGAVTWKSIVGTNVASDALSNLASSGVKGGALIVVGEDYGEGASVIQERTLAFALKSTLCLIDPRPELGHMTRLVEQGFAMSEAANTPVMMQLRIRTCHLRGSFVAGDNVAPAISWRHRLDEPAPFEYGRLSHPPATFRQEKMKTEQRMPAARAFIEEQGLNEYFAGTKQQLGIVLQGGLYNTLIRALEQFGIADAEGQSQIPLLVLNVTCPLVPEQIVGFCESKEAVLVVEEGQPEFIEQEIQAILRRAGSATRVHGKDLLPSAGEYTTEIVACGLLPFLDRHWQELDTSLAIDWLDGNERRRAHAADLLDRPLPARPPGFCTGCPERPVFSALKQIQEELGNLHVAADIGCHAFATFEPFSSGHTILGYGMSLASAAGVGTIMKRRTIAIMGDGGFWHNGLLSGVQSALFNGDDAILVILKNGYTSATGTQEILSSPEPERPVVRDGGRKRSRADQTIEKALMGLGVSWLRTVNTYDVGGFKGALREALTTEFAQLKVLIGDGECQLERQRRIRPLVASRLAAGKRTIRVKYGVDEDVCSGDHSCIRLSGCPTLTLKTPGDPLKVDPVVTITEDCVGCGLCGSNAHAATLCPSFYRAEVIRNPWWPDRLADSTRRWYRAFLGGKTAQCS